MADPSEKLGEFARIARYFRPLAEGFAGAFALGDDAAAFDVPAGQEVVATADAMAEGVHFLRSDDPASIARRLLRSNLSDLAAMGAEPHAYLLVTALPPEIGEDWLEAFARALGEDQNRYGIHLAGGDSTRSKNGITLSLTALGFAPKNQLLRRKTRQEVPAAKPYSIYVSGTIGDAALGLMISQGKKFPGLSAEEENFLKQRHYAPEPRLALGLALRSTAQACIDISDGLLADVGHIAEQSNAEAILHAEDVPLSAPAQKLCRADPELLPQLLAGGEDYELAFVVDESAEPHISTVAGRVNVSLIKIGQLRRGLAGAIHVLDKEGAVMPVKSRGWTHF
ncbi:MAG TPA: thiamine-phosphate kinase [Alphaproteobacteria bacterium]|nr:thiamine-phosphate kinase [Alphaproteobacteria bacterium]